MPGGTTKFQLSWLEDAPNNKDQNGEQYNVWCLPDKLSVYKAYCKICNKQFSIANGGKSALNQHSGMKGHVKALNDHKNPKQCRLSFTNPNKTNSSPSSSTSQQVEQQPIKELTGVFSLSDGASRAEIIWMFNLAKNDWSFRSVEDIGKTFESMFPDSEIAKKFSLGRTRASYVIAEGLGPNFRAELIADLVSSGITFSVHFDETTNAQVKKQLDLTLRYWSAKHNAVSVVYYNSLFFGHARGLDVAEKMYECMVEDGLPVQKIRTLIRDGPNVNKTIWKRFQELIKTDHPDFEPFVDLDTCALHKVHTGFGKGVKALPVDAPQLLIDVHSIFKLSASRREDYEELQFELGAKVELFQKHSEVRWLSLGPGIKVLIRQFDTLNAFLEQLKKDPPKSQAYKRVALLFQDKAFTKANLVLIDSMAPLFEDFLKHEQKSRPKIHLMYDHMVDVLLKLMKRFLKREIIEGLTGPELRGIELKDENFISDDDLLKNLGCNAENAFKVLPSGSKKRMILAAKSFFNHSCKHLLAKLPLTNRVLKDLSCLNPMKKQTTLLAAVANVCENVTPDIDSAILLDEWRMYQCSEVSFDPAKDRVDHFWRKVIALSDTSGDPKFNVLATFVKTALILDQGNADAERSLSINTHVVTKNRVHLHEKTITGLRSAKEAVTFHDPVNGKPENVPITKSLKSTVRGAYAAYEQRMKEEKEEEERRLAKKLAEKQEEERIRKEREEAEKRKFKLVQEENNLKSKKKELENDMVVANKMCQDASDKLNDAIKSQNSADISVASKMIQMGNNLRTDAAKQIADVDLQLQNISDKRSDMIGKLLKRQAESSSATSDSTPPKHKKTSSTKTSSAKTSSSSKTSSVKASSSSKASTSSVKTSDKTSSSK